MAMNDFVKRKEQLGSIFKITLEKRQVKRFIWRAVLWHYRDTNRLQVFKMWIWWWTMMTVACTWMKTFLRWYKMTKPLWTHWKLDRKTGYRSYTKRKLTFENSIWRQNGMQKTAGMLRTFLMDLIVDETNNLNYQNVIETV